MTDADVVAAIRADHLKSAARIIRTGIPKWGKAWVDPGFGPDSGPYVKLPVVLEGNNEIVIRVRAPERLRRKLAAQWVGRNRFAALRAAREGGR